MDRRIVVPRKDAVILSYKALRKAVGWVAILLPFVLTISYWLRHHILQQSISAYYYTGLRDLFVGSLCAIAMFMLCARGYGKQDEYAGYLSAACAIGVAFGPMDPKDVHVDPACVGSMPHILHPIFAVTLFAVLGCFCLYLFRLTDGKPTTEKLQRNTIYTVCGWTIYLSMATEGILALLAKKFVPAMLPWWNDGYHILICETVCLEAFGYA